MNRGEIRTEVLVRLGKDTTSAWTSESIVNDWIDQAHKWAAGYKKWPHTEGKVSTTFASLSTDDDGYLVGVFPEGWRSNSIRQLKIGGVRLGKRNFYKFQNFLEDNPNSQDKIFSDFGRLYYVNPNAGVSGTVTAWGQFTPANIPDGDANDVTETVFGQEDDFNNAIIEEVIGYAKRRDGKDTSDSIAQHEKAKKLLEDLWVPIANEEHAYQSTDDDGMFKRFDVLEGGFRDDISNRNQFR